MGGVVELQQQFESVLGGHLDWRSRPVPELVRTGVSEVDSATGGLPRGCLTEIIGPASSGRTSLLLAILAEATVRGEICALIDAEDAFDPASAASAGVRLERLLWVRSSHNAEHALKAADLIIQGGGFGLVVMDLGDTPVPTARRISLTSWFRLRRAVEHTPTVLVAVARQSNAKTCASLTLECRRERVAWISMAMSRGASGSKTPPASDWGRATSVGMSADAAGTSARATSADQRGPSTGAIPQPLTPNLQTPAFLLRSTVVRVASRNRSKVCSPVFTAVAI